MECEVFCEINGKISVLKAKIENPEKNTAWNIYDHDQIVAQLIRAKDFNGLQVWGSRILTNLSQEQMYWIGVQLNAA